MSEAYFANRAAAVEAVEMALPLLQSAAQNVRYGESGFLYVVVMNPAITPGLGSFEEAILYEHSVGDREQWGGNDYGAFARGKAALTWRTGLDSQMLQTVRPHLLSTGDSALWGSVNVEGIIVAVSGANPWFDEAFAGMVAYFFRGIAKERSQMRSPGLRLE